MEASKNFDEQIKRAMEGFESQYDSGAWDLFEKRLDEAAQAEADDLLKERLNGLEAPVQAGSWEAMEQLIEADEAAELIESEAEVDNLAYEKLHDFEVPFQGSHWSLMARRLEEEFSLRQKIYRYKVAELTLLALLLLTIVRFMPYANDWLRQNAKAEVDQPVEIWYPQTPEAKKPVIESQEILEEKTDPEEREPEVLGAPVAGISSSDGAANTAASVPQNQNNQQAQSKPTSGKADIIIHDEIMAMADGAEQLPVLPIEAVDAESSAPNLIDKIAEHSLKRSMIATPGAEKTLEETGLVASLGTPSVKSDYAWELPVLKTSIFEKPKQLRFSIFTSTDFNYVVSPPELLNVLDTTVATESRNSLAVGYGGGILVSFKKEKVEYQFGGVYSFKRYIPNTPAFLFETPLFYVREEFNGIQLDMLQVPLSVNYHFKDYGKWRFYGSGGVAGHFVTSSVYEIEVDRTPAFNLMPPPSSPDDTRSIRQDKDFPEGLVDGGQLRDNFYLTLNAGFGVERYFSPKWVVFFQPNYQHYLMTEGIGTNNDKIYSTSFYLGTKFSLK